MTQHDDPRSVYRARQDEARGIAEELDAHGYERAAEYARGRADAWRRATMVVNSVGLVDVGALAEAAGREREEVPVND